ncbi:MBL fold metallo-hydrolase [Nocardia nepalensis]|uniref:MBL fold metallo-hydrolase n=1 Tax=Nocardia nepalensis TaxID=3375448 RepID=UPI003B676393
MTVHHLDCATMCPFGGRTLMGSGGLVLGSIVGHCLLVEGSDGLTLVDTGFGTADVANPRRLGFGMKTLLGARLTWEGTAVQQVRRLGYRPEDVRRIAVTHLDLDHAGGLGDFPDAQVHVLEAEWHAATHPVFFDKMRYRQPQWAHGPRWVKHRADGESWFGLTAIPLTDDILLIPLPGHTRGHTGIAVRQGDRWLLHCGDTYFHRDQLTPGHAVPPMWPLYHWINDSQPQVRKESLAHLRSLRAEHGDAVSLFCAHDPHELATMQSDQAH